jgi:hypothetical protein
VARHTRSLLSAAALAVSLTATGCGHTHFTSRVTTSEPDAVIWLDGRPLRAGARVWALGPPHDGQLLVIARDGRRTRSVVSRRFTPGSLVMGVYTMGACLVLCWVYPEEIYVALPPAAPRMSWDEDVPGDPWLVAPAGWGGAAEGGTE